MSATADAARWALRRSLGLCGRCGRSLPPGHGKTSCPRCLAVVAAEERKRYHRRRGIVPPPPRREYQPTRPRGSGPVTPRERYARMRAAGLCVKCSSPSSGKQLCERHALLRKLARIRLADARESAAEQSAGLRFA